MTGERCPNCRTPIEVIRSAGRAQAAMQSSPVDLRAALNELDLYCKNYVVLHMPGYDLCAKNGRVRDGQYAAERWCLPCEVRAALRAVPAEAEETR